MKKIDYWGDATQRIDMMGQFKLSIIIQALSGHSVEFVKSLLLCAKHAVHRALSTVHMYRNILDPAISEDMIYHSYAIDSCKIYWSTCLCPS